MGGEWSHQNMEKIIYMYIEAKSLTGLRNFLNKFGLMEHFSLTKFSSQNNPWYTLLYTLYI